MTNNTEPFLLFLKKSRINLYLQTKKFYIELNIFNFSKILSNCCCSVFSIDDREGRGVRRNSESKSRFSKCFGFTILETA